MSWSISLGKIAGSDVRVHLTFLILLAWIGIVQYIAGGAAAAAGSLLFIIAVFACVLAHEFGHALAARRYGIVTPDITLLPIGGLARLSRIPENPTEEIVIAIAGPLVNVVIAAVLILVAGGQVDPMAVIAIETMEPGFVAMLAGVNIILVVFNLIPAFPMDGGRVLRAVLALRLGRRRATEIAARIGQALAFAFCFYGLVSGNPVLVFVGIFVFLAAAAEAGSVGMRETARRVTVDNAMVRTYETLDLQATIDTATDALIRTTQREFPVVDGTGRLQGFLGRETMIAALKASGPATPVVDVMAREIPVVRRGQSLDVALQRMNEAQTSEVAVVDQDDRLVGYVSRENLAEFMMIDDADHASAEGPWSGTPRAS
ncbi:MAG: site-2 protease family protein [Alphaproteobacteria bacterium]